MNDIVMATGTSERGKHIHFFATSPRGIENLLGDELRQLGAASVKPARAGVSFRGDLALACRACLWSRLANRILLPLAEFEANNENELYEGIKAVDWSEHLRHNGTLAVDFSASRDATVTHTHYGALKVKDAVVDWFRERHGERPSVDTQQPDVRLNVYLQRNHAILSLDLSGDSLHRRGYRQQTGEAPLKENLAAALLIRAGWPEIAARGGSLVDPLCGSATLPVEAALIASDIAPGLLRRYFGFLKWRQTPPGVWAELRQEAEERRNAGLSKIPQIYGYDFSLDTIRAAQRNLQAAGLENWISLQQSALRDVAAPPRAGLLIANPPYGERLGEVRELEKFYAQLGAKLSSEFQGWQAAVFTGNEKLAESIGLPTRRSFPFYNGALPCRLFLYEPKILPAGKPPAGSAAIQPSPGNVCLPPASEKNLRDSSFANRLRKNLQHLGRWARREKISCYRVYDADIPEYAAAVDFYGGQWAHVQEYAPPATIDAAKAARRWREILEIVPQVLEIPPQNVFGKIRQRQKGMAQYEKLEESGEFHEAEENGAVLLVNFRDYLDTGLFLDHRLTRARIRELAQGRHFLNLFSYTATATVQAALGGAASTVSVDLSKTYMEWAGRNLTCNGLSGDHRLVQADCMEWLAQDSRKYGLIFCDPPTFSNSKRMENTFDVQRDHVALLQLALRRLQPQGILIFSTNARRFKLDTEALPGVVIEDWTQATLPKDFERNPKIHRCWMLRAG
jgi:23S rRNA (guanine2445-N2)-methyltransferase / 23S rRNA (guanine2069-N7)-methyltransferase